MPTPGDRLGRYLLERELGRGGMGVVFLALDEQLDRRVAVKVMGADVGADPEFQQRFRREMRIASQIEHPNVVPVYEAGVIDDRLFIAMRYVQGSDLREILRTRGPLTTAESAMCAKALGAALDASHAAGLVHRDVKPANVLWGGTEHEPNLYLTDFGLARATASDSALTNTGHWMGTVDYVAPEQIQGGLVSARSDIYAMGCVLFETLTGRIPFEGDLVRKLFAHATEPLPSIGQAAGRASAEVDRVIARATAKTAADRYASAGDLARGFVAALEGEPAPHERSVATGAALAGIPTGTVREGTYEPSSTLVMAHEPAAPAAPTAPTTTAAPATVYDRRENRPIQPDPDGQKTRGGVSGRMLAGISAGALMLAALAVGAVVVFGGGAKDPAPSAPKVTKASVASAEPGEIKLSIASPSNGSRIPDDRVTVRGTVQPANATVLVQGTPATVGNGIFTASASLHDGTNRIDVLASSRDGVPLQKTITVTHNEPKTSEPTDAPTADTTAAPSASAASVPVEEGDDAAPAPHVPGTRLSKACDQNITASAATSCAFAANVFKSYAAATNAGDAADTTVRAYSDGDTVSVDCSFDGTTVACSTPSSRVNFPKWAAEVY